MPLFPYRCMVAFPSSTSTRLYWASTLGSGERDVGLLRHARYRFHQFVTVTALRVA